MTDPMVGQRFKGADGVTREVTGVVFPKYGGCQVRWKARSPHSGRAYGGKDPAWKWNRWARKATKLEEHDGSEGTTVVEDHHHAE